MMEEKVTAEDIDISTPLLEEDLLDFIYDWRIETRYTRGGVMRSLGSFLVWYAMSIL